MDISYIWHKNNFSQVWWTEPIVLSIWGLDQEDHSAGQPDKKFARPHLNQWLSFQPQTDIHVERS
jgi:hypothetical protein